MAPPTRNRHLGDDTSSKLEELPLALSSCDLAYLGLGGGAIELLMSLGGLALVSGSSKHNASSSGGHHGRSSHRPADELRAHVCGGVYASVRLYSTRGTLAQPIYTSQAQRIDFLSHKGRVATVITHYSEGR